MPTTDWLVRESRARNLQNRPGFVVALTEEAEALNSSRSSAR
jgi:hypothetical protein